jgi:hypothetical protein
MRLPRPYIPLAVRVLVAERQFYQTFKIIPAFYGTQAQRLKDLLKDLFPDGPVELDHDPPLAVRKKIHNRHGEIIGYDPPANSVDHLIYRKASDHRIKTYTRGEGAQYPDRVLIKKIRRIEHPKPKKKYKWPSRSFRSKGKQHAIKARLPIKPHTM